MVVIVLVLVWELGVSVLPRISVVLLIVVVLLSNDYGVGAGDNGAGVVCDGAS